VGIRPEDVTVTREVASEWLVQTAMGRYVVRDWIPGYPSAS